MTRLKHNTFKPGDRALEKCTGVEVTVQGKSFCDGVKMYSVENDKGEKYLVTEYALTEIKQPTENNLKHSKIMKETVSYKDLMFGDWVLVDGEPTQVTLDNIKRISETLCQPIELKRDHLEASGFEIDKYRYEQFGTIEYTFTKQVELTYNGNTETFVLFATVTWFEYDEDWGLSFEGSTDIYHIKYVHQLQNALHFDHFGDLAENFKLSEEGE